VSSRGRAFLIVVVLSCLFVAWVYSLSRGSAAARVTDELGPHVASNVISTSLVAVPDRDAQDADRERTAIVRFAVQDLKTRRPLAEASIGLVPLGKRVLLSSDYRSLGATSSDGTLEVDAARLQPVKEHGAECVLVRCRGHQRAILTPVPLAGDVQVRLAAEASLEFTIVSEVRRFGMRPKLARVRDVRVRISRTALPLGGAGDLEAAPGLAGSLVGAGIHTAVSDERGVARFTGLVPGLYNLDIQAERSGYACVGAEGAQSHIQLVAGHNEIRVTVARAYGVAVRFVGDEVVRVVSRYAPWAHRGSYKLAIYKMTLGNRFPGCHISVVAESISSVRRVVFDVWTKACRPSS